jgi:sulfonate transport system substrate-binding protein
VQKVVDAIVATMHWIATHSAADIANALPPSFVSNALVTKPVYISTLSTDKTQFLPDGMMPSDGPGIILNISKLAGVVTKPVDLSTTYTNSYAITANKDLGYTTG